MKEFSPSDLELSLDCSSVPTGPVLPQFEDWIAGRPELWSAGHAIQQEMYAAMLRWLFGALH